MKFEELFETNNEKEIIELVEMNGNKFTNGEPVKTWSGEHKNVQYTYEIENEFSEPLPFHVRRDYHDNFYFAANSPAKPDTVPKPNNVMQVETKFGIATVTVLSNTKFVIDNFRFVVRNQNYKITSYFTTEVQGTFGIIHGFQVSDNYVYDTASNGFESRLDLWKTGKTLKAAVENIQDEVAAYMQENLATWQYIGLNYITNEIMQRALTARAEAQHEKMLLDSFIRYILP